MHVLISLWLPIVLSAFVVFVISSLIHMLLNWHASDYGSFVNEDAIRDTIRAGAPKPGRYVIPACKEMKDMASAAMKRKYPEGPVGHITLLPNGQPNMGKYLGLWFLLTLLVSTVTALLASRLIPLEAGSARSAAKLAFAVSFVAYGFGTLQESIWSGRPWSQSIKYLIDAALFAAGTGAVFYWFWK